MTHLNHLAPGSAARVACLIGGDGIRRRLLDLGLTRGAQVECLYASPAGDPKAYLIRGAVVALRGADASQVELI